MEREAEMANRQAWNTAAMAGAAFAGKLKPYERIFGHKAVRRKPQSPAAQEAMLRALAKAWGAS